MANHILKYVSEDFFVQESLMHTGIAQPAAEYSTFLLRKRGYTTFQAVQRISAFFKIDRSLISYAGLKDEDAVTEQKIAIATHLRVQKITEFNSAFGDHEHYLQLIALGQQETALRIGHLVGNAFRIIVRRLSKELATTISALKSSEFHFINYYDTQRFGVPGGPKTTHVVGRALLSDNPALALTVLRESNTEESIMAKSWKGNPAEFFARLDPRVVHFYYAAHASHEWNQSLVNTLEGAPGLVREEYRDTLRYLYTVDPELRQLVHNTAMAYPLRRFSYEPGFTEVAPEARPALIQTRIRVVDHGSDIYHQGFDFIALEFFLPSGCYATMAVDQFLSANGQSGC